MERSYQADLGQNRSSKHRFVGAFPLTVHICWQEHMCTDCSSPISRERTEISVGYTHTTHTHRHETLFLLFRASPSCPENKGEPEQGHLLGL